jgi:hypothetical protein
MKNEYSGQPWLEEFSLVLFYPFRAQETKFTKNDIIGVLFVLSDSLNMKLHMSTYFLRIVKSTRLYMWFSFRYF